MRAKNDQSSNSRAQNKAQRTHLLVLLASTMLCFSLAATSSAEPVEMRESAPGSNGIITTRVILMLMLDSLLDALAEDLEEPEELTASDNDGLETAAEALMLGYAVGGVDPDLIPAEAWDALDTADGAEWLLLTEELGLDPSLSQGLEDTLEFMRSDLEEMTS